MTEKRLDVVEATWLELGRTIRAMNRTVFVRTEPVSETTDGGIFLPGKLQGLYGGLPNVPHKRIVKATVLASGPKTAVEPGERVCFERLNFAWLWQLEDKTYVGWIDAVQLVGYVVGTEAREQAA